MILHRNKLVGHSDKLARLKPEQVMISEIKRSDIDQIMKGAETVLNHVGWRYGKMTFGFGLPGDAGAANLLHWIKKGLATRGIPGT